MKPFFQKVSLLFVSFAVFTVSLLSYFPPSAKAQCPPSPDAASCGIAQLACLSDDIRGMFANDVNMCQAIVYEIGVALFTTGSPKPWYNPDPQQFAQKVFDTTNPEEIFGERYTYAQVNWIINSLIVYFFPPLRAHDAQELFTFVADIVSIVNNARGLFEKFGTSTAAVNIMPKYGFVGQTYFVMAQVPKLIFTSKISSGVDEVKYMASKFNIASPTYAQGLGYDKLGVGAGTIRGLWIATRNMAYLISTVILIAAGFMVIFRTKISPQASVTVQMIIPRLVISLVLATFSFAIVGFVIDMLYVFIAALLGFIAFSQGVIGITMITNLNDAVTAMTGDFRFVDHFLTIFIIIALVLLVVTVFLMIAAASVPTFTWSVIIGPIAGFVMGFFMWSVYVWARILGQLIVAYLTLILLTIAGPLMIIIDILPTSTGGFKKWIMCVIGNASVFASYAFLAILASLLFVPSTGAFPGFNSGIPNASGGGPGSGGPFIQGSFSLPGFAGGAGSNSNFLLNYFIFVGFMSFVPNIVASIKNMFCKTADPSDFLQNTVKDTIGQITQAGQNAAKGMTDKGVNLKAERGAAKAAEAKGR